MARNFCLTVFSWNMGFFLTLNSEGSVGSSWALSRPTFTWERHCCLSWASSLSASGLGTGQPPESRELNPMSNPIYAHTRLTYSWSAVWGAGPSPAAMVTVSLVLPSLSPPELRPLPVPRAGALLPPAGSLDGLAQAAAESLVACLSDDGGVLGAASRRKQTYFFRREACSLFPFGFAGMAKVCFLNAREMSCSRREGGRRHQWSASKEPGSLQTPCQPLSALRTSGTRDDVILVLGFGHLLVTGPGGLLYVGQGKSRCTVGSMQDTEFILVFLLIIYCILSHTNTVHLTFAPPWVNSVTHHPTWKVEHC